MNLFRKPYFTFNKIVKNFKRVLEVRKIVIFAKRCCKMHNRAQEIFPIYKLHSEYHRENLVIVSQMQIVPRNLNDTARIQQSQTIISIVCFAIENSTKAQSRTIIYKVELRMNEHLYMHHFRQITSISVPVMETAHYPDIKLADNVP